MPEPSPNADLLRALGRLVRGLSALFWGLPIALIVCFHTAKADLLRSFGYVPPLAATALLVYSLWLLGDFQKQERVWRNALDRARLLALINFGLSPFLVWYNRVPGNNFFAIAVMVMALSALLFLASINQVLQRLGAMLPDETLRIEIRQFTVVNLNLLVITLLMAIAYLILARLENPPFWIVLLRVAVEARSFWFLILLVLVPLAITMALIWKTKEVLLDSIFSGRC
jgi:hypothetical protein